LEEATPQVHPVEEEDDSIEEAAVESKENDAVENSTSNIAKSMNPMEEDQTQPLDIVLANDADTPPTKSTASAGSAFSANNLDSFEPAIKHDNGVEIPKSTAKESAGAAQTQAKVAADKEAEIKKEKEEAYYDIVEKKSIKDAQRKERRAKKKEKRSARKSNDTSKRFLFF
jgi:hypothetical protein